MADKPHLRVSDLDREQAAAAIREHYAAGRLDSSELEERLQAAYGARTQRELNALSADLPALPPKPPTTTELIRQAVTSTFAGGQRRRRRRLLPRRHRDLGAHRGGQQLLAQVGAGVHARIDRPRYQAGPTTRPPPPSWRRLGRRPPILLPVQVQLRRRSARAHPRAPQLMRRAPDRRLSHCLTNRTRFGSNTKVTRCSPGWSHG